MNINNNTIHTHTIVGKSMDSLKLVCTWDRVFLAKSAVEPVRVEGLLLQGAGFKKQKLSRLSANSPDFCVLPKCTFAWILQVYERLYALLCVCMCVCVYVCERVKKRNVFESSVDRKHK